MVLGPFQVSGGGLERDPFPAPGAAIHEGDFDAAFRCSFNTSPVSTAGRRDHMRGVAQDDGHGRYLSWRAADDVQQGGLFGAVGERALENWERPAAKLVPLADRW